MKCEVRSGRRRARTYRRARRGFAEGAEKCRRWLAGGRKGKGQDLRRGSTRIEDRSKGKGKRAKEEAEGGKRICEVRRVMYEVKARRANKDARLSRAPSTSLGTGLRIGAPRWDAGSFASLRISPAGSDAGRTAQLRSAGSLAALGISARGSDAAQSPQPRSG